MLRFARRLCGLTLGELGRRLGGTDYAAVSIALRRLDRRLTTDLALQRLCEEVEAALNV